MREGRGEVFSTPSSHSYFSRANWSSLQSRLFLVPELRSPSGLVLRALSKPVCNGATPREIYLEELGYDKWTGSLFSQRV